MALLDDANRANEGPPPSANWTTVEILNEGGVFNGLATNSGLFQGVAASENFGYWNAAEFGPDVAADAQIALQSDTTRAWLFARLTTPGPTTSDGYALRMDWKAAGDEFVLFRIDNGALTVLGSQIQDTANGEWIRLTCVGSVIKAYRSTDGSAWSEVVSQTDATYSGDGFVGMGIRSVTPRMDNFGAETLSAPGIGLGHQNMMTMGHG